LSRREPSGVAYCDICNPFQYATSIMGDPAPRAAHVKDVTDLFAATPTVRCLQCHS